MIFFCFGEENEEPLFWDLKSFNHQLATRTKTKSNKFKKLYETEHKCQNSQLEIINKRKWDNFNVYIQKTNMEKHDKSSFRIDNHIEN